MDNTRFQYTTNNRLTFQAARLMFHTFVTWNQLDYMEIYDISGTQLFSTLYNTQTGRPDIIIPSGGAYLTFRSNGGGEKQGFEIEYECYSLKQNGKYPTVTHISKWFGIQKSVH